MFKIDDNRIILIHKGKEYSWKDIKTLISPRVDFLNKQVCKNLLLCTENNFEFILNCLAGFFSKKEIFLLPDKNKLNLIDIDFIQDVDNGENITLKAPNPDNVYINFFTSGSTSTPKKVRKNLRNLIIEALDMCEEFPINRDLKFITTTRLTHMFGIEFAFIIPFVNGNAIDTDTIKLPEQITTKKCVFISTPSFVDKMVKYNDNPNPPEYIFTAGDKLKNTTFEFLEKNSKVIDIYGCTEAGTVGFRTSSKTDYLTPMKNAKVYTDTNRQLCVKSDYFLEDELTLNDLIEIKNNCFKILGRSDRILKIQEKRISAPELENYLNKIDIIENSYCMKVDEKIGAVVVLNNKGEKPIIQKGKQEVIKTIKSYLTKYSELIPQKWRFLPEIPKTITGKTDKEKILKIFGLNLSMPLILEKNIKTDCAELTMIFLRHSNFFQGHFPDIPVLPGVVQFFFAHFFAEEIFGASIRLEKMKKIKFSKVIKPDTKIILKLKNNDLSIDYTYTDGEHTYSSGTFIK